MRFPAESNPDASVQTGAQTPVLDSRLRGNDGGKAVREGKPVASARTGAQAPVLDSRVRGDDAGIVAREGDPVGAVRTGAQTPVGDSRLREPDERKAARQGSGRTGAPGTVYLVGAGPGAPDLLTLRAARLIAKADIVFHDALVHPQTIAMATRAEKVAVGKRCGRHSTAQHFINKRLIDAAHKHRTVVRLKGGDPMVFGRSQEEIDALTAAGVPVEVVPGVTAALAAAAQLRVALTRRGSSRSVTLVTPRVGSGAPEHDWSAALAPADTVAIYMGAGEAERVQQALRSRGYGADTPVALCESVSLAEARALRGRLSELAALAAGLSGGPAIILVGKALEFARSAQGAEACRSPAHEAACALPIARSAG